MDTRWWFSRVAAESQSDTHLLARTTRTISTESFNRSDFRPCERLSKPRYNDQLSHAPFTLLGKVNDRSDSQNFQSSLRSTSNEWGVEKRRNHSDKKSYHEAEIFGSAPEHSNQRVTRDAVKRERSEAEQAQREDLRWCDEEGPSTQTQFRSSTTYYPSRPNGRFAHPLLPFLNEHHSSTSYTNVPTLGTQHAINSFRTAAPAATRAHIPTFPYAIEHQQAVFVDSSADSGRFASASERKGASRHRDMSPTPPRYIHATVLDQSNKSKGVQVRRKPRLCSISGCDKLIVDHGVCIRHGGGRRCNVEGCGCRAQNKGLCWKHGGYKICQAEGCDKRAKSRGMCWTHGGGTRCKSIGCGKIAVSRGHCWAHGGGKRCKLQGCKKPASLRLDDFCAEHYAATRRINGKVRIQANES